ncbi:MAG TPA: nucleotide exchange factor GrpE [Holophagaceae bacterium]|nr:nucleotide exchange factor GrpE [Holophagaceae bacterium]
MPDLVPDDPRLPAPGPTVNLDAASLEGGLDEMADLLEDGDVTSLSGAEDVSISLEEEEPVVPSPSRQDPQNDFRDVLGQTEKQLEELIQREVQLMDQHKRLAADFNNFRNRTQRDIQLSVEQAERKLLNEILPVLDSFERALEASYPDLDAFRNGVELIRKQFHDALRRNGVEQVQLNLGDPFDALTSEALTTMTNPALPDGSVAAVYEKGFKLRDVLLRPARVVVNRLHPE